MKETGIIMSGDHPKLILDDLKTMTRRIWGLEKINDMPYIWGEPKYDEEVGRWLFWQQYTGDCIHIKCPYGHVGDRLWVKERHAFLVNQEGTEFFVAYSDNTFVRVPEFPTPVEAHTISHYYKHVRWHNPMFMYRWASRILLEITGVRVERLQEIENHPEDYKAEGYIPLYLTNKDRQPFEASMDFAWFENLWNSLNAKRGYGWETNPWVWVIIFKLIWSPKLPREKAEKLMTAG